MKPNPNPNILKAMVSEVLLSPPLSCLAPPCPAHRSSNNEYRMRVYMNAVTLLAAACQVGGASGWLDQSDSCSDIQW